MSSILTYEGERVGLGPIQKDLLPTLQRWWNDPKVMLPLTGYVYPSTLKDQEEWYEKYALRGDGSTIHFLIYQLDGLLPIGVTALSQINYRNQTAWASQYIGEPSVWGQGYGTEARRLLLGYAFGPCGLNNVTVAIHADNHGSLAVARKLGFREIGRQRQGVRRNGEYIDIVLLDILAADMAAEQGTAHERC
jgi:RimJ/RimL family protein N-acetyltransferase